MKTQSEKTQAILNFVNANHKCDNAQISSELNLGKETVRLILVKLVDEKQISFEVVGNNKKRIFSPVVAKVKKVKAVVPVSSTISSASIITEEKKKVNAKPAVVQTSHGLGLLYPSDPKVMVKGKNMVCVEKHIVHLVNENHEPIMENGKAKKVLVTMDKVVIVTPSALIEKTKVARVKREKGEATISQKNLTKYVLDGNVLSKGRLIHAIIAKFAAENKPSLADLNLAFPEEVIRPYGKLFVHFDEAVKINTDKNRTRFFAKPEDVIEIKGAKIAVSNQIDNELVKRMLTITAKQGLQIIEA